MHAGCYYLVNCSGCHCPDFQRHGLRTSRVGHPGEHRACKHVLAARIHLRAHQLQQSRRGHFRLLRAEESDVDEALLYRGARLTELTRLSAGHTGSEARLPRGHELPTAA